jgi:hypothetical protein
MTVIELNSAEDVPLERLGARSLEGGVILHMTAIARRNVIYRYSET